MGNYNIVNAGSMVAGQPEDISQVLANFQAIQAVLNGGIDNVNIRSTAAIAASKLAAYPSDGTKALMGDGTWQGAGPAIPVVAAASWPPASPVNGQLYIMDNGNGVKWMFRYNSSGGTYKFEFVGGAPLVSMVVSSEAIVCNGGYVDAATVGPQITLPSAGDYEWDFALQASMPVAPASCTCQLQQAGVAIGGGVSRGILGSSTAGGTMSGSQVGSSPALPTANPVIMRYSSPNGQGATAVAFRALRMRPIRVQ